jgi:hypothetical protein
MNKKLFACCLIIALLFVFSIPVYSEMTSSNYRITTSVLSGGGAPMISASYQTNSTLCESSPLMDMQDPPFSDSYDLYPGFWYTIAYYEVPKRAILAPLILLLLTE